MNVANYLKTERKKKKIIGFINLIARCSISLPSNLHFV